MLKKPKNLRGLREQKRARENAKRELLKIYPQQVIDFVDKLPKKLRAFALSTAPTIEDLKQNGEKT